MSRTRLEKAIRSLRVPAFISKDVKESDAIIALKANYRKEPVKLQEGINRNIPTYVIKSNTYIQIESSLREIFHLPIEISEEDICRTVGAGGRRRNSRRHDGRIELHGARTAKFVPAAHAASSGGENHNMISESIGAEPNRRVRISRP